MSYKNEILNVDNQITYEFEKSLRVFTKIIDSSRTDKRKLFKNYFNIASTTSALAMLNKLQNNVRVIEGKVIAFCFEQSSRLILGPCINDFPIVLINSTVVQSGDKIEVTAGVGSFYTNYNAEVFIYGKLVTGKDEGIIKYRFKAASKPGRYYVPVTINYTNQDGMKKSMQKEIEYTVANIQQQ